MKKTLVISTLLISALSFGQEKIKEESKKTEMELVGPAPEIEELNKEEKQKLVIYDVVDEQAEYPGGNSAAQKFLAENVIYPETALKKKLEGKCYVKFVVSDTGKVFDIKVVRGVMDCTECDKEVIRVLKLMPNWEPGKVDGKPVNSTFILPVQFKL